MQVSINVTGGVYAGASYEGALAHAPVTVLVPEGIVSARTTAEAQRVRDSIARTLETHERVRMSSTSWEIIAQRVEAV